MAFAFSFWNAIWMKLNETSSVDSNRRCRRFLEGDTNDAATGGLHNDCEIHQDADGRALWLRVPLCLFLLHQKITVWGPLLRAEPPLSRNRFRLPPRPGRSAQLDRLPSVRRAMRPSRQRHGLSPGTRRLGEHPSRGAAPP